MKGELVSISTADRVRLEGFFCEVDREAESTTAGSRPQAAILVHGLSGNFYKSRLLKHFAEALHQQHITTLLVNTRGHDYLNATARMGKSTSLGAAYEIIDECKHDLYAWAEFLDKRN